MALSKPALTDASPSNAIHHHVPHKPSLPIEIPHRRRGITSVINISPMGGSTSPDLIFEMSPVSSNASSQYALGFSDTNGAKAQEPFLYTFPKFSLQNGSGSRRQVWKAAKTGSQTRYPFNVSTNVQRDDISGHAAARVGHTMTPATIQLTPISSRGRSPVRSLKPMHPSPSAHTSSYSSTWMVPSKDDNLEEGGVSLETDAAPFDFEKYLMRRIEDRKPIRVREASVMSTIPR